MEKACLLLLWRVGANQWLQVTRWEILAKHQEEFSDSKSCLAVERIPSEGCGLAFTGGFKAEVGCPSNLCFKTSKEGESATSCGSLFHCQTALTVRKSFLMRSRNLLSCNLKPLVRVLPLQSRRKQACSLLHVTALEIFDNGSHISSLSPLFQAKHTQPHFS